VKLLLYLYSFNLSSSFYDVRFATLGI